MNKEIFEKWSDMAKKVQEPILAITELNVKTLQNFQFLKPEDLSKVKKPEELFEKQLNLAVENSHKALDYVQKSYEIMEKAILAYVDEAKKVQEAVKKSS